MKTPLLSYFFLAVLFYTNGFSQTSGIGEVVSIESKVTTIENNLAKIAEYKAELPDLENIWRGKIQKLKDELAALYKERDDLIADMKVGARCSQCNGWKSEFEKRGENFEKHLGDVKGYAIPATTAELEATRKSFVDKIAYKKVQILNMEKNNPVTKKQEDIKKLQNANDKLCEEITAHSKSYETKVFSETKSKHNDWMGLLSGFATNILIADDKITIYKARIIKHEKEFQEESEKIKERVLKENTEAQNDKEDKIKANEQQIVNKQLEESNYVAPLELKISELEEQKFGIESDLRSSTIKDSLRVILTLRLNSIIQEITTLENNIQAYKDDIQQSIASLETQNSKLRDEVFELKAGLTSQQEMEIAKIKPYYDQKISEANQAATNGIGELADARKIYAEKANYYTKQNGAFYDLVVEESNRMLTAGKKVNCPVWNDSRGKVMTNWNQVFPCVNKLTTLSKPYSTHVFNSYCQDTSQATYLASYKSYLRSLDDDDKNAVEGNSNVGWFKSMIE